MKLTKAQYRTAAFVTACLALLIVAARHPEAALTVATGALAIIGAVTGFDLL